jgi:hypothetical protein
VDLTIADYVQIDVQSGLLYLDAVLGVQAVPGSAAWALIPIVGALFGLYSRIKRPV